MESVINADVGSRPDIRRHRSNLVDRAAAVLGMGAVLVSALVPKPVPAVHAHLQASSDDAQAAARAKIAESVRYRGGEALIAAYGGAPYTYASDLNIMRRDTDMTVHAIDWEGRPFEAPIYYGVRVACWPTNSSLGAMIDFTHSKVYAPLDQETTLSGRKNGRPLPPAAAIGDVFDKLEFTHGHNMLTLNLLYRLPSLGALISPYVGIGFGAALPHTEVQLKGTHERTYEYQYAGPAGQVLIGIELRVPRLSYFVEYKFTTASYRVPLEHRDGDALPLDLWHQFRSWLSGDATVRGWASTWLVSHQAIGGMGFRTVPAAMEESQ